MTSYYTFSPSNTTPFQFQATFDGTLYNVSVLWSLYRQGWYVRVAALDGTVIAYEALSGSPTGVSLQSASWNIYSGTVTVTTVTPHGWTPYATIALTVSGCVPDAYNGAYRCFITGPSSFTFPLSDDPGNASVLGSAAWNLNLVAPFFDTSSLIYRTDNAQFEVSP